MSVLGNLIVILLTAGATYFGMTTFGLGARSGPLVLAPDIQKYVDAKLAGSTGGTGVELQKIATRLTEMEKKLTEIEKTKTAHEQLAGKSDVIESAIGEQRRRREEAMAAARVTEMAQLRNDIATLCAGVTIKRIQGSGKTSSPDATTFRNNIGAPTGQGAGQGAGQGGRGGGGAGGGGANEGPQWLQNMKNRRRGGQAPVPTAPAPPPTAPAPGGP